MKKHVKTIAPKKRKKQSRGSVVTRKGVQRNEPPIRQEASPAKSTESVEDKKLPQKSEVPVVASPVVEIPQVEQTAAVSREATTLSATPVSNEVEPVSKEKEKLVAPKSDLEIALVLSNALAPHQDDKAIDLCLMHSKDLQPDKIFFNADMIDYYHRSDIDRNPLRVFNEKEQKNITREIEERIRAEEDEAQERLNAEAGLDDEGEPKKLVKRLSDAQMEKTVKKQLMERALQRELQQLFAIFRKFREAHPDAELFWIYGCTEFYLLKFLEKYHPSLIDEINKLCRTERIKQVHGGSKNTRNNAYQYGELMIGHWFRGHLNSPSASVAHLLLDDEGVSLIQGHTKRGGWACRTIQGPKYISGYENFSLCKRPLGKNWQLGYSVVYKERNKKRFAVFQVPIAGYGFFRGDKEYQLDSAKVGSWEKAVSISDIHLPYEDRDALDATFTFLKDFQPDVLFVNGDVNDFQDISRFAKSPLDVLTDEDVENLKGLILESSQRNIGGKYIKPRLQREFEKIYKFFKKLRELCPNARIVWIFGNHEYRMQRYVEENAQHLSGVRRPGGKEEILSLADITRVKEFNVEVVYSGMIESSTIYGSLLIGHFYKVCAKSSFTASNLLRQKHQSLIQPHVHRIGAHYKTLMNGDMLVAVEQGCLCQLNPQWMQNPNWQHGFVVIHKKKSGNRFYLQPIHIVDGAFLFGGKRYGRKSRSESEREKPLRKDENTVSEPPKAPEVLEESLKEKTS